MNRTGVRCAVAGWRYAACGLPGDVLKSESWSEPAMENGEVRVKMTKAPILEADVQMVMGLLAGYKAAAYPAVAGTEGVGEIVECGPGASLKKGDKVAVMCQNIGTWATKITVPESNLFAVSSLGLNDQQLAMLSLYASAVVMSSAYGSVSGQDCIVLGADLPMGAALCAALKQNKAKVTTVSSAPDKGQCDFSASCLPTATFAQPKFIFNGVGGTTLRAATDNAADEAVVVTFANASRLPMDVAGTRAVLTGLQMKGFWYPRWVANSSPEEKAKVFKEAAALAKSNVVSQQDFPFSSFEEAFDSVYKGTTVPVLSM